MARNFSPLIPQEDAELRLVVSGDSLSAVTRSPSCLPNRILSRIHQPSDLERADDSTRSSPVLEDGLPDSANWPESTLVNNSDEPFALQKSTYLAFGSGRSRLPADWLQVLQESNRRYSLRDTDRHTFRGSGLQDLDKSGTYTDEQPERQVRPSKPKIRKIAKASNREDGDYGTQKPKLHKPNTLSYEQGRKSGRSMMLRLKFSSKEGLAKFKAITRKLSQRNAAEKTSDRYRRSVSDSAYGSSKSSLKDKTGVTTRRLALNDNDATPDHPYQNSEGACENILVHREARGCRSTAKKRSIKTRAQLRSITKRKLSSAKQVNASAKKKKVSERARAQELDSKPCLDAESRLSTFAKSVPGGRILYITTSFVHPIQFNWIPPPPLPPSRYSPLQSSSQPRTSSFPCHFCTDPGISYGLSGLGSKRVQVIQWLHDPTAGYEELEGGWVHAREEGTRMCQQCTMQRTLICTCTKHIIRPIKGLDPKNFDFEAAIHALVSQSAKRGNPDLEQDTDVDSADAAAAAGVEVADIKWCSVCLEPAFFECCAPPEYTASGTAVAPADDIGCGLLLCEVCAVRITGRRALASAASSSSSSAAAAAAGPVQTVMTLHELISAAARDSFHYRDGLRADVCFLMEDSELMRRQGAGWAGEDLVAGDGGGSGGRESVDAEENGDPEGGGDGDGSGKWDENRNRGFTKGSWGLGSPIDLT